MKYQPACKEKSIRLLENNGRKASSPSRYRLPASLAINGEIGNGISKQRHCMNGKKQEAISTNM